MRGSAFGLARAREPRHLNTSPRVHLSQLRKSNEEAEGTTLGSEKTIAVSETDGPDQQAEAALAPERLPCWSPSARAEGQAQPHQSVHKIITKLSTTRINMYVYPKTVVKT